MICPNVGPVFLHPKMRHPIDIAGGNAHIVDYHGNIMSYSASGNNTMTAAIIDIEALRQFRVMNLNSNWMKDLRTEVFRKMYNLPIHPKNLWMEEDPLPHEKVDEIYRENIRGLIKRGSFTAPASRFRGAHFQSGASSPEEEKWENIKKLWDGWGDE
jgi:beta-ureidopropionase